MSGHIIITGATGLVGAPLVAALEAAGVRVVRGTRRLPASGGGTMYWNAQSGEIDSGKLEGAAAVVHLAGENIAAHRWTRRVQAKDSRQPRARARG